MREFPSAAEILKVFEEHPAKAFRLRELVVELGLRSSQARELKHALKDLSRRRKIIYLKKNRFALLRQGRPAAEPRAESRRGPRDAPPPARPGAANLVTGR